MIKINIILPFPSLVPTGGMKMMYEIANRLHQKNYDISIYHPLRRLGAHETRPFWYRWLRYHLQNAAYPVWFPLDRQIKSKIINKIDSASIRKSDITLTTWWSVVTELSTVEKSIKGKVINYIQDYEVWEGNEEAVNQSFKYADENIVISKHLYLSLAELLPAPPIYIPLALDHQKFYSTKDFSQLNTSPKIVLMMFSKEPRKGSLIGLAAITKAKTKFPDLIVKAFGISSRPDDLAPWVTYIQRPADIRAIYDSADIFIAPSIYEGWGLTPCEAMLCGCAVICSDNGGHQEFGVDDSNVIMTRPGDETAIYTALLDLIQNNEKRLRLAKQGMNDIRKRFNWDHTIAKMEKLFIS